MRFFVVVSCLLLLFAPAQAQLNPEDAIAALGRGINLGNTLEPPREGAWNNGPAQEYYFDDYAAQGFETVRIPVRWDEHTAATAPFAVDASWMDRVEQVVDWALARDLYVIINAHHEDWLKQNYGSATLRARFDAIWTQVAERFQDKSERLLFEVINEPFGMTVAEVDDLNARILGIIRATNPTRIVILGGNEYSNMEQLERMAVPDDDYLLAYFHSYDPWPFAGQGQGTWGTEADRAAVRARFERVAAWTQNTGVPVMISEFGVVRETPLVDRLAFYAAYVEESVRLGIPFQVWDDGGMFRVYRRGERTWNDELDMLLHTYPDSPTNLSAAVVDDTTVVLTWRSRLQTAHRTTVERRLPGGTFEAIADFEGGTTFVDESVGGGRTYQYRLEAQVDGQPKRISVPVEIEVPPFERSPFNGQIHPIPGVIEAEDFDQGGEGLTYSDTTPENIPGAYRPGVGVDLENRDDGGVQVSYIEFGEWLEYTLDVAEAGTYTITTYVAAEPSGGRLRYLVNGTSSTFMTVMSTGSWQTLSPLSTTLDFEAGEQILRLDLYATQPFNVDRIEVALAVSAEPDAEPRAFAAYPNPTGGMLTITPGRVTDTGTLEVYDLLGRRVRQLALPAGRETRLDLDALKPGIYIFVALSDGEVVARERIVKL
ncbi:MAG: cellulase family glycosylhydrolase [Bacteroidota bacterium]